MKHILIILGLFASVSTFAQSPRIKLNQITKDTVKGSVLISSPTDSGMVYSRDFYVAYGADTVLILYGDTISGGGGLSSVLSDGVTITGDGSVGNPLKVDTLLISTIQGLVDTLTNRGYLTANQTITLSGDVTGSGTTAITATVVDDSHNHIISNVDFLQDSLDAKANDSDLANYVTIAGAETITGAKTFTNTFTQSGGDANFDSGTLYVDESANSVGIGTSSPSAPLDVVNGTGKLAFDGERLLLYDNASFTDGQNIFIGEQSGNGNADDLNVAIGYQAGKNLTSTARANVFLGALAASNNTVTGYWNLGIGYNALYKLTSGISNLGIGIGALDEVTTGDDNIGIGFIAGRGVTTGSDNVYIGASALPNSATVTNEIVIGSSRTGRGSNTISLGNTSITSIAGQVSFSTYSDFRDKKNISDLNDGLNILMKLRPVKFVWNTRDGGKVDVNDIGFIAQEVDGVQYQGIDSDYINIVNYNELSDEWTITYDKFIPLLTKAIQEQQAQIELLQTELDAKSLIIETQEQKITDLETTIQALITRIENLENK